MFLFQKPLEKLFEEQYISLSSQDFHDSAELDSMPVHLDEVVVGLHVVHASMLDLVHVPLEANKTEIAPGVRIEIGTIKSTPLEREPVLQGDDMRFKLLEFDLSYSIDRRPPELNGGWAGEGSRDEPGDSQLRNRERGEAGYDVQAFEGTPIIAATMIRDSNGVVLYDYPCMAKEALMPATIEGTFDRLSVRVPHYAQAPLWLESVVLHRLELHRLQMAIEDRAVLSK